MDPSGRDRSARELYSADCSLCSAKVIRKLMTVHLKKWFDKPKLESIDSYKDKIRNFDKGKTGKLPKNYNILLSQRIKYIKLKISFSTC